MNSFFAKYFFIKRISALLVLLTFLLCITPKKTLHTWFANHKDCSSSVPAGNLQLLTKAGFNCNCDDLVSESTFVIFSTVAIINFPSVSSLIDAPSSLCFPKKIIYNLLRGPPCFS